MKIKSLVEVLIAAHFTTKVNSDFASRGGILLVAPPASLKTTIINAAFKFHDAVILSDINIQTLIPMRDDMNSGKINSLAFTEVGKLYQRNAVTSSNIEGHLAGMVEEGFTNASFEDQRMATLKARCLVVGGMTPSLYRQKYTGWDQSGFLRRFLWCVYQMKDKQAIMNAIDKWKIIELNDFSIPIGLGDAKIPYQISSANSRKLRHLLRDQPGQETPFILLKKIFCVVRYWHRAERGADQKAMDVIIDFAQSLERGGAELTL